MTVAIADELQPLVLGWGEAQLRVLPWRQTRDPWAVLVSEVMLQQTQVDRVIPKWHAFLAEFPTPTRCAQAPLGDVLRQWQGLGYPRRARNLHLAAQHISESSAFPSTLEGLLALPGVGPYTARAVMAFAYNRDVGVVDTNIARVYARVEGRPLRAREAQTIADSMVPGDDAWSWNQSLMDLGAVLCRARAPLCARCPLVGMCRWRGIGDDPATGSAFVSAPQSRFDGSNRQARGRLLASLAGVPLAMNAAATTIGWPDQPERVTQIVQSLLDDGLIVRDGELVRLP